MKQLVNVLFHGVLKQCKKGHCNIIRLENFDHPQVYRDLCQNLKASGKFDSVQIKLTEEKFQEFTKTKEPTWDIALDYFHQGDNTNIQTEPDQGYIDSSYVDFGNAMTKWRNKSAEQEEIGMSLMLLLGTETATDKGGLADTSYLISPKELIDPLRRNYATWFTGLLEQKGLDSKDCSKSIHSLYSSLFTKINIDLFRLSHFVDDAYLLHFDTEQDFISHICQSLHQYWQVPSIKESGAIPKISNLAKGRKAGKIIEETCKFFHDSRKPLSNKELEKLDAQFDHYAQEHDIDVTAPFPDDSKDFSTYQEFRDCFTDFLRGKNKEANGQKLLPLDYSIITSIHAQKLPNTKVKKDKRESLTGDPIQVYATMFLNMIHLFHQENDSFPTHIKVDFKGVSLADCDDTSKEPSFGKICQYLGGIVDYFQNSSLLLEQEPLEFAYENDLDPFVFVHYPDIAHLVKSSGKWGEPSKIDFSIQVSNDECTIRGDYRWLFSPYSDWLNSFYYLVNSYQDTLLEFDGETSTLPTMVSCERLYEYCGCESSQDFYGRMLHFESKNHYLDHMEQVKKYFDQSTIYGNFLLLNQNFSTFLQDISENGLFSCLNHDCIAQVVSAYSGLMESIKTQYSTLSQMQKEKLILLLNCYMITSNKDILNTYQMDVVLLPSYHPTILEKISAKLCFVRDGFSQMLQDFSYKKGLSSLTELIQLSSITQGVDMVWDLHSTLIPCQEMWEYYAVYYQPNLDRSSISTASLPFSIVEDEETSASMLKATPVSSIVIRNVLDYVKTFPSRVDGLSISFLAPLDMQHIVSAIHSIAKIWNKQNRVATINLKIITINSQKNSASYLRAWIDSYFSEENHVRVNTSLRNLSAYDQHSFDYIQLEQMIEGDDLCFVYQVLTCAKTQFSLKDDDSFDVHQSKFPMVFLPEAISTTHGKERKYCISQGQFLATAHHTQANGIHSNPDNKEGAYETFQTLSLEEKQIDLLESVHKQCNWVVCLDKAIDRDMLEKYLTKSGNKIVGFTTGEGSYGELNVTVSAKKVVLQQIKNLLRRRIEEKFSHWNAEQLAQAADFCVEELTPHMDGSRILKALNPYDYEVHSYLAYTLMIQKLGITQTDEQFFMRRLISLDSYLHWFDHSASTTEEKTRPDFMLVEIPKTPQNLDPTQPLELSIRVIECKMGFLNDEPVDKARMQLENGLNTLISHWDGDKEDIKLRYWLNQLYRVLIFLPLQVEDSSPEYGVLCRKIHGIIHGHYEISWSASLYGFWLNLNEDGFQETVLNFAEPVMVGDDSICEFDYYYCGQLEIQKLLLPPSQRNEEFDYIEVEFEKDDEPEAEDEIEPVLVLEIHTEQLTAEEVPPSVAVPTDLPQVSTIQQEEPSLSPPSLVIPPSSLSSTPLEQEVVVSIPEVEESIPEPDIRPAQAVFEEESDEVAVPTLDQARFLIGEDNRTKQKCYWEFGHKSLPTRHLLINGNSGCGKTYCIQSLLMEATLQGVSSVVFDYTGGFAKSKLQDTFKERLDDKIVQRIVRSEKIPINPFVRGQIQLDDDIFVMEEPADVGNKIAEILSTVFRFGDQQKSAIYLAVVEGVEQFGEKMSFSLLTTILEDQDTALAKGVLSKIRPFLDVDPFAKSEIMEWSKIRDSGGMVYVVQLVGYSRDVQVLLTELLLWDIWNFAVKTGNESKPFILVMDEAQNLDHREKSPSGMFLTEGRKFGISAWYATQFMKPQLSDDEIQRLQQADQKLYFCPPDEGVKTIAKNVASSPSEVNDWIERLKKLKKGECVTCGQMVERGSFVKYKPRIINVTSLEDRL